MGDGAKLKGQRTQDEVLEEISIELKCSARDERVELLKH